jgi:hypothetical protein
VRSFEYHRIQDTAARRAAFQALEPKVWWEQHVSPTLVIMDAAVAADVLRSPLFVIPDLRGLLRELRSRHPLQLEHLQQTLDILPPFLEGAPHARIRKLLGQYLSVKRPEIEAELPDVISTLLGRLDRTGTTDFIPDLLVPLTRNGRDLTDQIMEIKLTRIFEAGHSASSLQKLDQMLGRVFDFLDAKDEEDNDFICLLCSIVFGIDNIISTLAENIASAFQTSNGTSPAELPQFPVELMLSATYRRPVKTTEVAGHEVQPSTLVRIHIEPFGYSSDKALNAGLFGVGRHACIGKQLSLDIWKHLAVQFNARAFIGRITEYHCEPTHSFNFVKTLKVDLLP